MSQKRDYYEVLGVSKNADGSNRKLALWPSDHFGILTEFK
jgi:hypothetical protein